MKIKAEKARYPDHCLSIDDGQNADVHIYLNNEQLRQLHGVIGARLAEWGSEHAEEPSAGCICIHEAGDNRGCVVHRTAAEA